MRYDRARHCRVQPVPNHANLGGLNEFLDPEEGVLVLEQDIAESDAGRHFPCDGVHDVPFARDVVGCDLADAVGFDVGQRGALWRSDVPFEELGQLSLFVRVRRHDGGGLQVHDGVRDGVNADGRVVVKAVCEKGHAVLDATVGRHDKPQRGLHDASDGSPPNADQRINPGRHVPRLRVDKQRVRGGVARQGASHKRGRKAFVRKNASKEVGWHHRVVGLDVQHGGNVLFYGPKALCADPRTVVGLALDGGLVAQATRFAADWVRFHVHRRAFRVPHLAASVVHYDTL